VEDAAAAVATVEDPVVGHVIAMGEEHERHAAELADALEERPGGARRVDEHVPVGAADEVRRGAVGIGRGVAAEVDLGSPSMGTGRARAAARTSTLETLPMEAVGQLTRAMRARRCSSGVRGCARTRAVPRPESPNVSGASVRQVSQSMQLSSTYRSPRTFSGSRRAASAMLRV
jgi:hypothetical protein